MKKQDEIRKDRPSWRFPDFDEKVLAKKKHDYCVCIFVINEGERIKTQLKKMKGLSSSVDIIIADGGSTDESLKEEFLKDQRVRTLLTKKGPGKLSAQMRMAFAWALSEGYKGVVVVDGNNKDSVERTPDFVRLLKEGYDHVQGSRFILGGRAVNTPLSREIGLHLIHAPLISLASRKRHTDTTNGFRAYSRRLLLDKDIAVFRDIFQTYELHYHLAIESSQRKKYHTIETPVIRTYPKNEKTPTKISPVKGNIKILTILFRAALGFYKKDSKFSRVVTVVSRWTFQLWFITTVLALFFTGFFYPGLASSDTIQQWKQVVGSLSVGDWHPPYMVYVWSILNTLTHKMGSLLILQQLVFWISIGFLAQYIYSHTKNKYLSLMPVGLALTSPVLGLTGVLWKDVQLAIALLAASTILLYALHSKRFSTPMKMVSVVLILYAALLRYNAMVAAVPLLFLWLKAAYPNMRTMKYVVGAVAMIGAIYVAGAVVSTVGHVTRDHPTAAVMLDDIVGAGRPSEYKDISVDVKKRLFAAKAECDRRGIVINTYWGCISDDDRRVFSKESYDELSDSWLQTILGRPLQYLGYRIYAYNIFLFGAGETQYLYSSARVTKIGNEDFILTEDFSQRTTILNRYTIDFTQRNFGFLFRPWFWLLVSAAILYIRLAGRKHIGVFVLTLTTSSLLYILSYLPVTVATDYRYIYWPVIALSISLIFMMIDHRKSERKTDKENL